MSRIMKFVFVAVLLIATRTSLNAQRVAVSTNLLEDAILTPNVGVEIVLADQQSITFDASCSPYKLSQKFYNKCMTFRAGYKYWFDQALYAHYLGVDLVASSSDFGLGKLSSRDEYIGIGIGYGYSFIICEKLNIAPHLGVGIAYGQSYDGYDHMASSNKGVEAVATRGFKPILTRFGVTIQYVLK